MLTGVCSWLNIPLCKTPHWSCDTPGIIVIIIVTCVITIIIFTKVVIIIIFTKVVIKIIFTLCAFPGVQTLTGSLTTLVSHCSSSLVVGSS